MSATTSELARVKDFALWKPGFGRVTFDVPGYEYTDVRNLDLSTQGALTWGGECSLERSRFLLHWNEREEVLVGLPERPPLHCCCAQARMATARRWTSTAT
jgi:hypothetical protein